MEENKYKVSAKTVNFNLKYTFIWTCPKCGAENAINSNWDSIIDKCPGCENMFEITCE